MTESAARTAVIAGATGLVGGYCLQQLLDETRYCRVAAVARSPSAIAHEKLHWLQSDFNDLAAHAGTLAADDAYCCLGTTLRRAGSRAAFERVDYHMVLAFARAVHAVGVRRFMVVSAFGADSASPSYYSRVKARMEQAVSEVGFEAVHVLRPSLLLGQRNERRPLEALGQRVAPIVTPLLRGRLRPMRPVQAEVVAQALVATAFGPQVGVAVHRWPFVEQAA